jgi:hypothetical protein
MRDVCLLDPRDEDVRQVDIPFHHLQDGRLARRTDQALDAGDVGRTFQPIPRVPAERVPLCVESLDDGEWPGTDRVWVQPPPDVPDLREDVLRHDPEVVRQH